MKEEYYAGDRELELSNCYKLQDDTVDDFSSAISSLELSQDNIRWTIWTEEDDRGRIKYVLYRDKEGLKLRTK